MHDQSTTRQNLITSEEDMIRFWDLQGARWRYSLVNWIWCQPRAPSGKTFVRASGWV